MVYCKISWGKLCRKSNFSAQGILFCYPSLPLFLQLEGTVGKNLNHDMSLFMLDNLFWILFIFYQNFFFTNAIVGLYHFLIVLYLILLMSHACKYLISWMLVENWTHKIVWSVFWHHSWKQMFGVFWHQSILQSIDFLTSTGWPILPFNSDTNYPNLVQTPQIKTQSHKTAPSSDANCN